MKRVLVIAGICWAASVLPQDLGAAWFVERGRAVPVVFAPVGQVRRPLGLWFDLDVSVLLRPLDGVRIGGAVTGSFRIADNAWATIGVGGLASDRFEWSSIRPGLVVGIGVRF